GFKVRCIGDVSLLPSSLQARIAEAHVMTSNSKGLKFILPTAYGSREDVVQDCRRIAFEVECGAVRASDIDQ
ncbi:hypothetical protein SELMODRAFT_4954, partial [Selaginella moellendorffii]